MDNTTGISPSRKRHEDGGGRGRSSKKPRGRGSSNNGGGGGGGGSGRGRGRGGRGGGGGRGSSSSSNGKPPPAVDPFVRPPESTTVQDDAVGPTNSSTQDAPTRNQHQFSNSRFVDQDDMMISPASKRALTEVLKYEYMTKVQEATLPTIVAGVDVVAKAKTGSGKTTGASLLLPLLCFYYGYV
jgi:hypothetical protein